MMKSTLAPRRGESSIRQVFTAIAQVQREGARRKRSQNYGGQSDQNVSRETFWSDWAPKPDKNDAPDLTAWRHDEADLDSFGRRAFDMSSIDLRTDLLVQTLRRALPLTAHGRSSLRAALRRRLPGANLVPRVTVIDVFYAGEKDGLMCRVDVQGAMDEPIVVVAPIAQLAFNRGHPLARDVAAYRKRRTEAAMTGHGGA